MQVKIIGAGLAGCEAALWLADRGVQVELYEQKPAKYSPAHKSAGFAELICSNSLKAERPDSASGLLKIEMKMMGSHLLDAAETARVAAGGVVAAGRDGVVRDVFSTAVTEMVENHPNITVRREEVTALDESAPVLVASGPLTEGALAQAVAALTGDHRLSFYDAVAPIVTAESLDYDKVFAASRYGRGEADYLNCPFNKEEYEAFHAALIAAERAPLHDFDGDLTVYEGCMPIEVMAARGADTIRFGPLRPVGLRDPRTGHRPWAAVQLRAENTARTLYNLVGFQTNLKWGEQKRVFSMIPGLEHAEFVRYGVMHRNTFLESPKVLTKQQFLKEHPNVFFAGQITGFEGYMESAASGLLAAHQMLARLKDRELLAESGFPGMKVLQFAFTGEDSVDLPHNYPRNCVAYPGTHDNNTLTGWFAEELTAAQRKQVVDYFALTKQEGTVRGMLRGVLASTAALAIIPMADWLGETAAARMNTPGQAQGNWQWRADAKKLTPALAAEIRVLTERYFRAAK